MDDRDKFETVIDQALASGSDADLAAARLVYADWLDEQNTAADARLAHAQRWMAQIGASPECAPRRNPWPARRSRKVRRDWFWYHPGAAVSATGRRARLPIGLWDILASAHPPPAYFWQSWPARQSAEAALADALHALG
jgi:uncharacterized protein (TIGR02996 family)